jgi:hypothetical protein
MEQQPANGCQHESTPRKPVGSTRDKEFRDAVDRVYRKYGHNLDEFLRDVQKDKELSKKG